MSLRHAALAALVMLGVPGAALAAAADGPGEAADFIPVEAENGPVNELQVVLEMQSAGPDAGIRPCFGRASFARTAWARVPASDRSQRITVEATPRYASTRMPDLGLFVQGTVPVPVSAPGLCDGRDLYRGYGRRGDPSAAVSAVLPAGASALVQVGWRNADPPEPILVSLSRRAADLSATPPGDDPASAPLLPLHRSLPLDPRGATLGPGDPATPSCQAPATVWRKLRLRHRGVYEARAGDPGVTIAAFAKRRGQLRPIACRDLADARRLTAPFTARRKLVRLRVGVDDPATSRSLSARVLGPFARRARGCTRARHPQVAISRLAAEDFERRRSHFLLGTARQPCGGRGRKAKVVVLGIARCTEAWRACSATSRRHAQGVRRWQLKARSLPVGHYRVTAQALGAGRSDRGRRALDSATLRLRVTARG